jgi:RimJ/RimL family protein N-acetyltransferase
MSEIKTKRLLLRPVEAGDALEISSRINNLQVSQNLTRVPWPYRLDDFYSWHRRDQSHSHTFAVVFEGEVVGVCGLEADVIGAEAELGYWLAEAYWNQGIMSEAADAVVDFGFGRAGYDLLHSGYKHGNVASRKILLGLGFRPLGHKRMRSESLKVPVMIARVELTKREWERERVRK